jgi:predicted transcriptional regulator
MALAHKVTITLQPDVLKAVDRISEARQTTRSAFVATAIDAYLRRVSEDAAEETWARSYAEHPQQTSSLALELLDSLPDEEW